MRLWLYLLMCSCPTGQWVVLFLKPKFIPKNLRKGVLGGAKDWGLVSSSNKVRFWLERSAGSVNPSQTSDDGHEDKREFDLARPKQGETETWGRGAAWGEEAGSGAPIGCEEKVVQLKASRDLGLQGRIACSARGPTRAWDATLDENGSG